jgi:hypothetical protein
MAVDGSVIVALAALGGSLVGACSSIVATFMGQRLQARWARLRAELEDREKLYGLFVEEAVHLFVDSIRQSAIDPAKIMRLYSKVARIRLTSNDRVLSAAEEVGRRLFEAYERPPGNPVELLARYANGDESLDPLREFTEACREERATALE